jgi:ribosomal protein S18 acetylase RimI-like enzyme
MLRSPRETETDDLLKLAVSTGLFSPEEADALLGETLGQWHAGKLPAGHAATVAADAGDKALGWSYFAPDPNAGGVWNLWWIGCRPDAFGSGVGRALLAEFESVAHRAGARILIVETSSSSQLDRARRFYAREGYAQRGDIPNFYGPNDNKLIFVKEIAAGE